MTRNEEFKHALNEYRNLDVPINKTLRLVGISAIKKQIPKKPVHVEDETISNTDLYQCPSCDRRFLGKGIATYCYHCGQKLDWGSEE